MTALAWLDEEVARYVPSLAERRAAEGWITKDELIEARQQNWAPKIEHYLNQQGFDNSSFPVYMNNGDTVTYNTTWTLT